MSRLASVDVLLSDSMETSIRRASPPALLHCFLISSHNLTHHNNSKNNPLSNRTTYQHV